MIGPIRFDIFIADIPLVYCSKESGPYDPGDAQLCDKICNDITGQLSENANFILTLSNTNFLI